jgi:serine/threonine-protein kinase
MTGSTVDRNLLFGVLALQMDFISRDALVAAMNGWVLCKHRALGEVLVDQGALLPDVAADLDAIVERHLELHRGDSTRSLGSLRTVDAVRAALVQVADPEIQVSLTRLPSEPGGTIDPDRTIVHARSAAEDAAEPAGKHDRFRILRPHARGGLGEVFVAHDEELNREVALKEILIGEDRDPDNRRRFLMEAEITGRLEHPGIVPVYGLGSYADGRPYYAMRFIEGQDLRAAIKDFYDADKPARDASERRVAFRKLLGRFVDVCNAVAFAHSKGVLHRDLKPANVMLGKYGETLVVDWGLAKPIGRKDSTADSDTVVIEPQSGSGLAPTLMGSAVGTPAYMSPEQAAGRLNEVSPASDIYSLGATLYALLTDKSPIEGNFVEILRKVQQGEIVPPRQANPSTPEPLDAICRKAMSVKPHDRYASALDLAKDVELWLSDEPVSAWQEPPRVRAGRWVRKHRTLVVTALATLFVAAVGLGAVAAIQARSGRELAAKNRELEDSNIHLALARDQAERRVELAVGAIENFRTAVDGNLDVKNRPENAALRKTLLGSPLAFYQKLRDDLRSAGDVGPGTRAKLGDAYLNLAALDYDIGSQVDARQANEEAASIFETLSREAPPSKSAEVRGQLVRALKAVGTPESLAQARELCEAAVHENADDVEMRVSLAEVLDALASFDTKKGDIDAALSKLRTSTSVLEEGNRRSPGHLETGLSLSATQLQISSLLTEHRSRLPEAQTAAETALQIMQPLVRANPENLKWRLSAIYETLGDIEEHRGGLEKSAELRGKRLDFVEEISRQRPTDNWWKHHRVQALLDLAYARSTLGANAEALALLQKARDLSAELVHDNPTNSAYKVDLNRSWARMAFPLSAMGRVAEALAAVKNGAVIQEELARSQPDSVQVIRDLAGAYYNSGALNKLLVQLDASMADYQKSLELRERLVREHPDDPSFAFDVASTLGNMGGIHIDRYQWPAAMATYQRASGILQEIAVAHPENAEYQNYFLRARGNEAVALTKMGKSAEALEILRANQKSLDRMAGEHPGVFQYQHDAAGGLEALGETLQKVGKLDEAASTFQTGIDIREKLLASNPSEPDNLDHLVSLYKSQAALERERKRPAAVAQSYRRAFKTLDGIKAASSEQCYNLCCYQTRLATAASADGSGLTADEVRAEFDKAMATLTRAVASGFQNTEMLRTDTDLEGLRKRDDFKKLVEKLTTTKGSAKKP